MKRILAVCLLLVTFSAHAQSTINSKEARHTAVTKAAAAIAKPPSSNGPTSAEIRTTLLVGTYKFTTAPDVPFPLTMTLTLTADRKYRYEIATAKAIYAYTGTWTFMNDRVITVDRERFLNGKPAPSKGGNDWKPGITTSFDAAGDELYKGNNKEMTLIRVQK